MDVVFQVQIIHNLGILTVYIHVCTRRRICVFLKLYTVLKTIVFHFCFSHGFNNSNSNCSMVLAASLQHGAESTRAFGFLPLAAETTTGHQWWPGGHWYRSVSYTSTGRSPGGHWYRSESYTSTGRWPLVQIATDVGSRWEKSEFRLWSFFWIFKVLVPDFWPGFSHLVPANTNTLIRRRIKQAQTSAGRNSNLPCGTRGKIGHQINRCVIFCIKKLIFRFMR